jgi:hypothetical protein
LEKTLEKVIEIIRRAAMLNLSVELLTLRLGCEARYPGSKDIKIMIKIIIDEITRVVFNGDLTNFTSSG